LHRLLAVVSTAYCLSGTMADGSGVRAGSVASNHHPLGTRLVITPAPYRRRYWVVRDRIGWGTELDFWLPTCGRALGWGRRTVRIRRWRRPHLVGTVRGSWGSIGTVAYPLNPLVRGVTP
jgi:3D (Asp-Asp-Asp) domain-containing protein